jgi:hypothetical protein
VIHGKGLTSPNREPVLKGKVRAWLTRWNEVLAYCEAMPHGGGSGAVLVLLRGRLTLLYRSIAQLVLRRCRLATTEGPERVHEVRDQRFLIAVPIS